MFPTWEKCRDMYDGEEKVKSKRELYLPRPEGMEKSEYEKYVQRTEFFNATGRTIDGLHGQMFRKDVVVEVPEQYKQYLDNVDGKGQNFNQFVSEATFQTLITGWGAIFLDAPKLDRVISQMDAEKQGIYPYMSYCTAENLYNWHYDTIGRQRKLTRACIHEKSEMPTSDPFTFVEKDKYRLLYIDENGDYKQEVKIDGKTVDEAMPTKSGKAMKSLPIFTVPNLDPEKPITLDLVNTNIAWYRKSADLENGGHWTGVPTPYVLGYEPETQYDANGNEKPKDPIYLGGSSILCLPTGTAIGYLEYTGSGLSQLRQMMMDDEERMAILGARIISAERKGVEAVETARIHRAGENSVLASFANNMSDIFKNVLIAYLEWITGNEINPDEIKVQINTDYDVARMSSQDLASLVSCWQAGGISKRVLFDNLKEGEVIPNETDFDGMEDEIAIEKEQQTQMALNQQVMMAQAQQQVSNGNTGMETE